MGCSFEVTTNGMKTQRLMSKACFASINAVIGQSDRNYGVSIDSVKYLPFLERTWCTDADATIDKHVMAHTMTWDVSYAWWEYLMTLKFVTDGLVNTPTTELAMKDGFTVNANMPADRVMITLFLLRAPQYQAGLVTDWHKMQTKDSIHPDTAFVMTFWLNHHERHTADHDYHMSPYSSTESAIVYPEYFTLAGARIMLNRLLCDDYDAELYGGKQANMKRTNSYKRFPNTNLNAIGRYFCKKPAKNAKRNNLQVMINNQQEPDNKVKTHSDLSERRFRPRRDDVTLNIKEMANLLEA